MNEEEILQKMELFVQTSTDSNNLVEFMIKLRQDNLSALSIYELLQKLRWKFAQAQNEAKEDLVLEAMDYNWFRMR